eukprot:CAMPEP_0194348874 /NCGR_PEP_ID=MMETSP0171-20130528/106778_1 /TAXON_ID=218684 /ORGANISM="Corethron pennatum, Strain L29A3" /LENGTH=280 /DNA_ID=CAMNT_0039116265 /DNA_START=682 /DNA_END=1522 /DNA_ORIENTATION=+
MAPSLPVLSLPIETYGRIIVVWDRQKQAEWPHLYRMLSLPFETYGRIIVVCYCLTFFQEPAQKRIFLLELQQALVGRLQGQVPLFLLVLGDLGRQRGHPVVQKFECRFVPPHLPVDVQDLRRPPDVPERRLDEAEEGDRRDAGAKDAVAVRPTAEVPAEDRRGVPQARPGLRPREHVEVLQQEGDPGVVLAPEAELVPAPRVLHAGADEHPGVVPAGPLQEEERHRVHDGGQDRGRAVLAPDVDPAAPGERAQDVAVAVEGGPGVRPVARPEGLQGPPAA